MAAAFLEVQSTLGRQLVVRPTCSPPKLTAVLQVDTDRPPIFGGVNPHLHILTVRAGW